MRPELIGGRIIFCTWGLKLIQVISRFGVYLLIFVLMCRDRPVRQILPHNPVPVIELSPGTKLRRDGRLDKYSNSSFTLD